MNSQMTPASSQHSVQTWQMKISMIALLVMSWMPTALLTNMNGKPRTYAKHGSAIRAIRSSRRRFLSVRYSSSSCPSSDSTGTWVYEASRPTSPVTSKHTSPYTQCVLMTSKKLQPPPSIVSGVQQSPGSWMVYPRTRETNTWIRTSGLSPVTPSTPRERLQALLIRKGQECLPSSNRPT